MVSVFHHARNRMLALQIQRAWCTPQRQHYSGELVERDCFLILLRSWWKRTNPMHSLQNLLLQRWHANIARRIPWLQETSLLWPHTWLGWFIKSHGPLARIPKSCPIAFVLGNIPRPRDFSDGIASAFSGTLTLASDFALLTQLKVDHRSWLSSSLLDGKCYPHPLYSLQAEE